MTRLEAPVLTAEADAVRVDPAHSNHLGQKIDYAAPTGPPAETVDLTDQG